VNYIIELLEILIFQENRSINTIGEYKMVKKWIQAAHIKKGALHKELGVPAGKKIPEKKLKAAAHSKNPVERKRAVLAETFAKMRHKKK